VPLSGDHFKDVTTVTHQLVDITPHLWSWQVVGAMFITFVVQGVTIGAYAARLAGVQTKRIATSISLFNLFSTFARLTNLFSVVLIAPLSDKAGNAVAVLAPHDPATASLFQANYGWQLRFMILGGTLGMMTFAAFLPMFTYVFRRGIDSFERRKSVLTALRQLTRPTVLREIAQSNRWPTWTEMRSFSMHGLPKRLFIFNVVVTGVYAIGVQASYLASVLDVEAARTAISLSGVINGIGTIAFTLFVDPTSALITDQAIKGERTVEEVRSMVFFLSLSAILGTLVSQIFLGPAAGVIVFVAHFFTHIRG
jgi:hypothetical protein